MNAVDSDFSVLSTANSPKLNPFGVASPNMSAGNHNLLAGVQAGYNFQTGAFVWGGVADFDWVNNKFTQSDIWAVTAPAFGLNASLTSTAASQTQWLSTVRAKAGLLVTPVFDLYVTGGMAFGQVDASYATGASITGIPGCAAYCGTASVSSIRTGWAAGTGAEYAINPNWSAFAEYMHYDLGDVSGSYTATTTGVPNGSYTVQFKTRADGDVVKGGFNYRFNNN